jgi:hypothetical protein
MHRTGPIAPDWINSRARSLERPVAASAGILRWLLPPDALSE